MIRPLLLLLLMFASRLPASEPVVETEIVTVAIEDPLSGLYFRRGRDIVLFEAGLTGFGSPLHYRGAPRMELRASEAEFASQSPPPPAATVDLPRNSDRVLVVCLKAKDAAPRFLTFDISKASGKEGDYRVFNFSHSLIHAMIGPHRIDLKPGLNACVSDPAWGTDVLDLEIKIATGESETAKRAYGSVWGHRPGRRNFVFLFDGAQACKPVKICRFFDLPASTPEITRNP